MDHVNDLLSEVRLYSDADLPHYSDCINRAFDAVAPVFTKKRYSDFFFHCASIVPGWLARVVIANADAESHGSEKLHYLWRGAVGNQKVSTDVLEHAKDEAGHSRIFVSLVQEIFPNAYGEAALADKRKSLFRIDKAALEADRFRLAEDQLIDHLVQMNMGEIRTRIHMQLLSPVLFAFTPSNAREHVSNTLHRLVTDEVRHINYTARFIEAWCENGDRTRIRDLYTCRLRDFHKVTIEQTQAAVHAYGQGIFPEILEI
jgi:hypothetical protein